MYVSFTCQSTNSSLMVLPSHYHMPARQMQKLNVRSCPGYRNASFIDSPTRNISYRQFTSSWQAVHITVTLYQLHWLPVSPWVLYKSPSLTFKTLSGLLGCTIDIPLLVHSDLLVSVYVWSLSSDSDMDVLSFCKPKPLCFDLHQISLCCLNYKVNLNRNICYMKPHNCLWKIACRINVAVIIF